MPAKINLDEKLVIRKYNDMGSIRMVGRYFNVSFPPILRILKKNGIDVRRKNKLCKYFCQICGKEFYNYKTKGFNKFCSQKCSGISHRVDLTNKRFGRLLVIKRSDIIRKKRMMWECICDCGKIYAANSSSLQNGHTQSCGCLRHEPRNIQPNRELAVLKHLYNATVIRQNKSYGIKTDISLEEFILLVKSNCYYCDSEPYKKCMDRIDRSDVMLYCNSLDQIIPGIGYSKNNVVPCCKNCNNVKNNLSVDEFKKLITDIYNNWASK